jgi:prepilin peptidase CpaA
LDPSSMLAVAVGGLLLIASASDIARLRIPNWISAAILAAFALFVAVTGVSLSVLLQHLAAGLTVLAFGIAMFAWGKLGGGDVKLLSAVSLCVGWGALFQFLFAVSLFGALVSLVVVVLRIRSIAETIHSKGYRPAVLEAEAGAPYAIAIAGGFFFLLLTPIH